MEIIITENHLFTILNEVKAKADERDKIYQDDRLLVVAPLTHRASCKYGAFTNWCTSVPSNDEHFFVVRYSYQPYQKLSEEPSF